MIYYNCRSGLQGFTRPNRIQLPVKYHQIIKRTCLTTNTSSMQNSHAGHNTPSDEDEPHILPGALHPILQNPPAVLEAPTSSTTLTRPPPNPLHPPHPLPPQ